MLSWRRDKKDDTPAKPVVSSGASQRIPDAPEVAAPTGGSARVPGRTRLGELLVHEGVITQLQLNEALQKQQTTGAFIGQTLVELGYLNQSTLVLFLVKQCKIPHISLLDYNVGEDLFKLVPKDMCQQHRLLPIDKLGKILTLAMVDPLDADALEKVRELCPDLKIKPILCTWNHFEQVARKLFAETAQQPAELSMGSFGLASKKSVAPKGDTGPDEKSEANKAVAELVKEVAPVKTTAAAPKPAPAAAPKAAEPAAPARVPIPEALFDRMGDHVRVALTESLTPLIAEQQKLIALQLESAKGKPAELAREITSSMRASLLEGLAPLLEAQGKYFAQASHAPIDTSALARELGESIRASLQNAMAPLLEAQRRQPAPAAQPQFDPAALAKELGDGVRAAMLDSVLPVLQMGEPSSKGGKAAAAPAFDPKIMADHFAQYMDRSMASFAKEMREAIAANSPQKHIEDIAGRFTHALQASNAAQNERIADLTDTTKQALLALREALDTMRAPAKAPEDEHAPNVSPFPGLRATDVGQGNAALQHFDPMEEIGLGIEADDRVREALLSGRLQRAFTFEAFLSGAANTFTLSVARAVTEKFSREFTPFYIYGDVGVGKTHLVQAIGNTITARDPDLRVAYMTGLRFVSACERAARDQDLEKFRESFAHWDVLLFDDAQSVAAHKQAQDELRALLGVLTNEGRLVVVSADRAPDQLPETSHQLVSRLAAGIVSRLHAPDMPTRVAILQRHARVLRAKVADDILSLIASRVPVDVRKMTGALRKALAYAQVSGTEVTHELTEEILSHLTAIEAA
ncbi:MAG: ATP-binding protein [Candidatus Hydrogenedentes bacterium]|nr:ATP-binding protein [Candidatus Hydrogenedentota bacterium]